MVRSVRWLCWLMWVLTGARLAAGELSTAMRPASDLVPGAMRLIADECAACHNPKKTKGGLILTTREGAIQGSDDGEVLVPGRAVDSRMFTALAADAEPHMPPKRQLTAQQVELVRAWIDAGAA